MKTELRKRNVNTAVTRVGTAGWAIPKDLSALLPGEGSHLQRYARVFNAVEINSSFYRPHRPVTYARWATETPDSFLFALKVPKAITHEGRLADTGAMAPFLSATAELGPKRGVFLIQLPPNLAFDPTLARHFFEEWRSRTDLPTACEPRHRTWFMHEAAALLSDLRIARVAADPSHGEGGDRPGGWPGLRYHRLHGSPRVYYSAYAPDTISRLAEERASTNTWIIFDNTALGAATRNALDLRRVLGS